MRLVDPKAAGAQTLRLVMALVVSVGVTGAVTGPLAYRAVEFRSSVTPELATETDPQPSPQRGVMDGSASRPPASGVADATSASATSAGSTEGTGATATPGSPPAPPQPGSAAAVAQQAGATDPPATTTAGENGVSPATVSRPPAITAVAGTEAAATTSPAPPGTPTPGTTAPPATTPTTRNPLDEFNPRPSCDDKAQELNAEDRLACASTSPGG
ncbi:MAG: hypothetical protein ACKV2O_20120 [Acidimicrobiales bacterium]